MAKWDGFSEEDIKKVRACERLVEGNIRSFSKSIYRVSNLTENDICTTFGGIRLLETNFGSFNRHIPNQEVMYTCSRHNARSWSC
jgi:hypothetical protein